MMNKYTELSDFEINKKVASHYLLCDYNLNERTKKVELIRFLGDTDKYSVYGEFDPCNNPADAMPIIIENGIAFIPSKALDSCYCVKGDYSSTNKSLYRAAMEVFLMTNDSEPNN